MKDGLKRAQLSTEIYVTNQREREREREIIIEKRGEETPRLLRSFGKKCLSSLHKLYLKGKRGNLRQQNSEM